MRWPWMSRDRHDREVRALQVFHDEAVAALLDRHQEDLQRQRERFQALVDAEYKRARGEGIAQVHRWAVEANYNLFYGKGPFGDMNGSQRARSAAALQEAEHQFRPGRTELPAEIPAIEGDH